MDGYTGFVARHINDALTRFGRSIDDLKLVLPHNVNAVFWATIAKSLGLPRRKIYLRNISRFGHCFGADPFLNLLDAEAETDLRAGDLLLAVGVGMGMSAATSLIEVCPHPVSRPCQTTAPQKEVTELCR